ncbi:MAG: hypothetical protein WBN43_23860 [Thiogranum sp.]
MNWALEFHDSRLFRLHQLGRKIIIQFEPAYLHCSDGEPGISPGSGWHQNAELVFRSASIDGSPDSEGSVSEGTLDFQGVKLNLVPAPCRVCGGVAASFTLSNGNSLKIKAESVELRLLGEPVYIDKFHGE